MSDAVRPEPEYAVETEGLTKVYAGGKNQSPREALKSVDLKIPRGSFFALLGPNGAGKSTLINILAGLVLKTSGTARVWGHDIETEMRAARRAIGVVPQELNIDPFFTPRELLDLQAGLYGVPRGERRTAEVLRMIGLADRADSYTRRLSGGMRRRLLVGKAMVHQPPVLVLDEPSAGVDVDLRRQLWVHVKELNRQGVTVLLTTHYLEEAESLCDTIAIINHGQLIACEPTSTLLSRLDSKEMWITVDRDLDAVPERLAVFAPELTDGRRLGFTFSPSTTTPGQVLAALADCGLGVVDLATREADLEDVFLRLTRDSDRDAACEALRPSHASATGSA